MVGDDSNAHRGARRAARWPEPCSLDPFAREAEAGAPNRRLLAIALFLASAGSGSAQVLRQRIVSTSGVPHGDVADYRRSPYWRSGMPIGMNPSMAGVSWDGNC